MAQKCGIQNVVANYTRATFNDVMMNSAALLAAIFLIIHILRRIA